MSSGVPPGTGVIIPATGIPGVLTTGTTTTVITITGFRITTDISTGTTVTDGMDGTDTTSGTEGSTRETLPSI